MAVDRRTSGHQRVDIGHCNQQLDTAVGQRLARGELVEVERVVVVERAPRQRAHVDDARIAVTTGAADRSQFAFDCGRKPGLQPALDHHVVGNANQVGALAGHFFWQWLFWLTSLAWLQAAAFRSIAPRRHIGLANR